MPMDTLAITDLEVETHIGDQEEERSKPQKLLVSVEMHLDTKIAGKTDDLKETIDYDDVKRDILEIAKKDHRIIEHFAEKVAESVRRMHQPEGVTVVVKKFPYEDAKEVSITISRP